jgi:glucose-6-phosphate isomerase
MAFAINCAPIVIYNDTNICLDYHFQTKSTVDIRMTHLTETKAWKRLEDHFQSIRSQKIKDLGHASSTISAEQITFDFSHQLINQTTLQLLLDLAEERELEQKIEDLFTGKEVNNSEKRPALHMALRRFSHDSLVIDGKDIMPEIRSTREQMREISNQIRHGDWLGHSGKPITDVVNIGIGGSHLGPFMCVKAFKDYQTDQVRFHFISDADPKTFSRVTAKLNPETTLFIVSSKSFTTQETLYHAKKALHWIGDQTHFDKHFIAVTAQPDKAVAFGINRVLKIWDWVGGRYSLCSAINLITCIAIGFDQFQDLLLGAEQMDKHFLDTDFSKNLPVLLALLGIWNNNFLQIHHLLILTYAEELEFLMPYIQQLDMESNGKSIDKEGYPLQYATGPIIWGGMGNQAQHSYYQLLCQGTHRTTADLISVDAYQHEMINKMCIAKQKVLSQGIQDVNNPNGFILGNSPVNNIRLAECTPRVLGALIAMYEHKIYTQSVIWNINPFDQPGVESAKVLMRKELES